MHRVGRRIFFVTSRQFTKDNNGNELIHFYDLERDAEGLRQLLPTNTFDFRFAISLIDRLPHRYPRLLPEAIVGWSNYSTPETVHQDFYEQAAFLRFLHHTLSVFVDAGGDDGLRARARQFKSGWMHIADERALPVVNRTPDPDDIVGLCLVRDGRIVPKTYQAMPTHRLFTHIGEFQLPAAIHAFVLQHLQEKLDNANK
jgi:hypothetical protein